MLFVKFSLILSIYFSLNRLVAKSGGNTIRLVMTMRPQNYHYVVDW